jgi:dTDP-4-amino-4,6-dideoxygalactose transaminase
MTRLIRVTQSSMPGFEEYIEEIRDLWDSHWLTNMGHKHQQFESALIDVLGVPYVTLFTNGHLALECAIEALQLQGEVITTPFTFASTTHAIVRKGLTPVFCDIRRDDYTIDAQRIESLITDKTSAIMPVHVYGHVCDVRGIAEIAAKYHLKVIYDAAHCFGVTVDGVGIGNFGDASMMSFHATKVFHTIEGGAVTYTQMNLKDTLDDLKNYGFTGPESVRHVGGNAKMNEFQAAMGLCNLRHVDSEIKQRQVVFERYTSHLQGIPGIQLVIPQQGVTHNYAYMPVVFDGYRQSRDEVYEELKKHEVIARKYFYPLTSQYECYAGQFDLAHTPVAQYVAQRILTLPLYAELALADVDRICEIITGS